MGPIAVVALGGQAILRPAQQGAVDEQRANLGATCRILAQLTADGYRLVITHGTGLQIRNLLVQNLQASAMVPPMPLDICTAESQGQVGYLIQNALEAALAAIGCVRSIACLLTRVMVNPQDPAFRTPRKPVGPIYTPSRALDLMSKGLVMQAGPRGWRQVVPSPQPVTVLESPHIRTLLDAGAIVVAGGGGGIPVVPDPSGGLQGVEAMVEKDLTAARIGAEVGADLLVLLSSAAGPGRITPATARKQLEDGAFGGASLAIKIDAAARFAETSGGRALITDLDGLTAALRGEGGMVVAREAID